MLAIALIVGAILLQGSAQNVGTATNTIVLQNKSLGTVTNSSTAYLTDYRALGGTIVVTNSTNGAVIASSNYTITNNVVYNGQLAVKVTATANDGDGFTGAVWQINSTAAQPLGYIGDAGSRSIAGLIVLLMALAMAAVAIGYAVKGYQQ